MTQHLSRFSRYLVGPGPDCAPPITAAGYIGVTGYGTSYTYDNLVVTDQP